MPHWKKSDIGKIIRYRNIQGYNEKVAIYNVPREIPNEIEIIEHPISLNSRIALLGLVKSQEVKGEQYLKNPGDWYLVGTASKDERGVLEKLANSPRDIPDIA